MAAVASGVRAGTGESAGAGAGAGASERTGEGAGASASAGTGEGAGTARTAGTAAAGPEAGVREIEGRGRGRGRGGLKDVLGVGDGDDGDEGRRFSMASMISSTESDSSDDDDDDDDDDDEDLFCDAIRTEENGAKVFYDAHGTRPPALSIPGYDSTRGRDSPSSSLASPGRGSLTPTAGAMRDLASSFGETRQTRVVSVDEMDMELRLAAESASSTSGKRLKAQGDSPLQENYFLLTKIGASGEKETVEAKVGTNGEINILGSQSKVRANSEALLGTVHEITADLRQLEGTLEDGIGEQDIRKESPEKKEKKKKKKDKKKKKGMMKGTLSRALRSVRSMKRARRQQGKASLGESKPHTYSVLEQCKCRAHKRDLREFERVAVVQRIRSAESPIWAAEFSTHSLLNEDMPWLLATGGQDGIVRVWRPAASKPASGSSKQRSEGAFASEPFREYTGHLSDVVGLSWSKATEANNHHVDTQGEASFVPGIFLLSASTDKSVRLWHTHHADCLMLFQHADFVTCVDFHPTMDDFFVTGSFDRRLRIWSIPEGRVVQWTQVPELISAVAFAPSSEFIIAGLLDGTCIFYNDELKYYTQIELRNKNGKYSSGRKVTGIRFDPSGTELLVTTNDSRIRAISMADFSLSMKFKGATNTQMQIFGRYCGSGSRVICGSEDGCVVIWRSKHDMYEPSATSRVAGYKREKNHSYEMVYLPREEGQERIDGIVTCAMFAPISLGAQSTGEVSTENAGDTTDHHHHRRHTLETRLSKGGLENVDDVRYFVATTYSGTIFLCRVVPL